MDTIDAIRHANLLALLAIAKGKGITQKAFAEKAGINPKHMSSMVKGDRNVGDASSAKIAASVGKPAGWMDVSHAANEPADTPRLTVEGSEEYAGDPLMVHRHETDIEALTGIFGVIVATLAVTSPETIPGLRDGLLSMEEKFQDRGPVFELMKVVRKAARAAKAPSSSRQPGRS